MTADLLRYSNTESTHRLVLLHGWGADAEDLIPIGQELCRKASLTMDIVSLRGPQLHPEGNGRQWYGLFPPNWVEVPLAISALKNRLEALASSKIPLEKTVLLGFSQGGAMGIASGTELPLAGVIGCSAYRHPGWVGSIRRPPVMLTHGINDEVVPFAAAEELRDCLKVTSQEEVELFGFEGGHCIPLEMINGIQLKLQKWLN